MFEVGQFHHNHSGKARTMGLFWLRTSYHAKRYMFQRYMLRSLLTQSFNIVNSTIILLFSKKWVPGLAAEDNKLSNDQMTRSDCIQPQLCSLIAYGHFNLPQVFSWARMG